VVRTRLRTPSVPVRASLRTRSAPPFREVPRHPSPARPRGAPSAAQRAAGAGRFLLQRGARMAYAPPARGVRFMDSVTTVVARGGALGERGSRSLVPLAPRPAARRVLVPEVVGAEPAESGVPRLAFASGGVLERYTPAVLPIGLLVDVYV
jgi:hypothetical protein